MISKKKKVSSAMKPYIEFVLKRDEIPYQVKDMEEYSIFSFELSNKRFHEVYEDALCEIQRKKYKSGVPVYSLRTILNEEKLSRLSKIYGKNSFHILEKDKGKYKEHFGE